MLTRFCSGSTLVPFNNPATSFVVLPRRRRCIPLTNTKTRRVGDRGHRPVSDDQPPIGNFYSTVRADRCSCGLGRIPCREFSSSYYRRLTQTRGVHIWPFGGLLLQVSARLRRRSNASVAQAALKACLEILSRTVPARGDYRPTTHAFVASEAIGSVFRRTRALTSGPLTARKLRLKFANPATSGLGCRRADLVTMPHGCEEESS